MSYIQELERERKLRKIRGPRADAPATAAPKAGIGRTRCGPVRGTLNQSDRDRLPDKAFGQPALRKYPLYVLVDGVAVPDKEHAVNAKARAAQQFDGGHMSRAALGAIVKRADVVIAQCARNDARKRK